MPTRFRSAGGHENEFRGIIDVLNKTYLVYSRKTRKRHRATSRGIRRSDETAYENVIDASLLQR